MSTTSGTSGAESAADGSGIGSPVLANVDFDFLNESLLEEDVDADAASSSDSEGEGAATDGATPKPGSALSDFSRWSRIPIGAFRSRTMGGGGSSAPSQVFAAKAAASKKGGRSKTGKKASKAGGPVATSILRDYKAAHTLNHTLGSPGHAASTSKRAIKSRMLTSPVLAPVIRGSSSARPGMAGSSAATGDKKSKRGKRSQTPAGSARSKSPASRSRSRQASNAVTGPSSGAASTSSLAAPTANLPPLHSPLFRGQGLPEPSAFRLN